ncbi:ethanolamine kinase-like protein [Dendryphion nanum]|uniref:ethanolamine kinase n=1 Tax=Dendryphion nanum TaxID=256645 RepID=A0A9P9IPZ5_9PLEO|nr:ethanolamine kinase-like protein [Dendryphion nanum]
MGSDTSPFDSIRHIPLSYNYADSHNTALNLILTLRPEWRETKATIDFVRFTDGITNTLLKAINKLPGLSETDIDRDAILLRAYGKGTDVIIDRERESLSHSLLARHNLAPDLLARFDNGLLYKYIQGTVCQPSDLRRPEIWRGVAQRLGEWHATLPVSSISTTSPTPSPSQISPESKRVPASASASTSASLDSSSALPLAPGQPIPNIWTTMQKWIQVLPSDTPAHTTRRSQLSRELAWLTTHLGTSPSPSNPFVFAHCDLLSGNVIIEPTPSSASQSRRSSASGGSEEIDSAATVSFIDYEYTCPAPASFDIANHFAEWGGFDCDYSVLPTRAVRRAFLREYLRSYALHLNRTHKESEVDELFEQVDRYRGVPGIYWGIWALIQSQISLIDFDYKNYAEVRLGEYWAWKREVLGERVKAGEALPEREVRWGQEE